MTWDDEWKLDFGYDIAGHQDITTELNSSFSLIPLVDSRIYTQNSGPLSFTYDIAGHQNLSASLQSAFTLASANRRHISAKTSIQSSYALNALKRWHIQKNVRLNSSYSLEAIHTLNLGYSDEVYFGDVCLRYAQYDDIDTITFPFREKQLYGGYRSIRAVNVRGFSGRFKCETNNWNDIQALLDLIGQPRTLRIWGKPYRNCYIKPDFEFKTVKKKLNRWVYWVTFMQDSAITEIST